MALLQLIINMVAFGAILGGQYLRADERDCQESRECDSGHRCDSLCVERLWVLRSTLIQSCRTQHHVTPVGDSPGEEVDPVNRPNN